MSWPLGHLWGFGEWGWDSGWRSTLAQGPRRHAHFAGTRKSRSRGTRRRTFASLGKAVTVVRSTAAGVRSIAAVVHSTAA